MRTTTADRIEVFNQGDGNVWVVRYRNDILQDQALCPIAALATTLRPWQDLVIQVNRTAVQLIVQLRTAGFQVQPY